MAAVGEKQMAVDSGACDRGPVAQSRSIERNGTTPEPPASISSGRVIECCQTK
jgi:hypothetical protein